MFLCKKCCKKLFPRDKQIDFDFSLKLNLGLGSCEYCKKVSGCIDYKRYKKELKGIPQAITKHLKERITQ